MTTQDRQGYLGDLHQKTVPELRELLDRQENILKKKKFLLTLPDKGTKVKTFADTLRKLIAEKENFTRDVFSEGHISENKNTNDYLSSAGEKCPEFENSLISAKGDNSDNFTRDVVVLGEDNCDVEARLSEGLGRVNLSETSEEEVTTHGQNLTNNKFINSYERVIKQASQRPKDRRAFKPNSTLNITKIQELPEAYKFRSLHAKQPGEQVKMEADQPCKAGKHIKEESAACLPDYKHNQSLLIPMEESVKLVEEQKKKHEELLTRQAAERLASRLHIQLDDYNPEGTNMNYRVPGEAESDSDDEPELVGYDD